MKRRQFLFVGAAAALLPSVAFAADFADKIIRRLRKQGYTDITTSRTLLGRVRILAWRGGESREIILNPHTGEILRDVWTAADGRLVPGTLEGDDSDDDKDDDKDDDEEDDDEEDDGGDDDNSGSGGGDDDED
ncbi:hypothetical protein [Tabrizicola fusiformis]|uniref:hypothetical protein n=1 Tax=Tabrizicola sp. SY72 TaxID=2741673 RepID=UPI00157198E5|nr:hypothetical protein [Tabrizicola sp. SY72]NTT86281.1 hypothetical protein [Tabrizicola sp. SY72]